ncbi:hypothetical protein IP360_05060 [Helicobacter winghamensis]|uniref:hypothetical protein n=1 Tax=Helicobacter winghamensis TaxID=157268 RepID=UPI00279EF4CA
MVRDLLVFTAIAITILWWLLWLIIVVVCFVENPFLEALGYNLGVTIVFAIGEIIIGLSFGALIKVVTHKKTKIEKSFLNASDSIFEFFEKINIPNFDFYKYTQYAHLSRRKTTDSFIDIENDSEEHSLSLPYKINFDSLKCKASTIIAQKFFDSLQEKLKRTTIIYDMLKITDNEEKLFLDVAEDKEEIQKIAWSFREFIAIKLEQEELPSDETWDCIHALKEYMQHLKMHQLLKESRLYQEKKLDINFCKDGKWEKLSANFDKQDTEILEMMTLKQIFEKSLDFIDIDGGLPKRIINDNILTTLDFKNYFKTHAATYFFKLLNVYLFEKQKFETYRGIKM